ARLRQFRSQQQAKKETTQKPSSQEKTPPAIIGQETQHRDGEFKGKKGCGHSDTFNLLEGEIPAHQASRLAKWKSKKCQACVEAEIARQRAGADERRQLKRLPDKSVFHVQYDAEETKWRGSLTVPSDEGTGTRTFDGESTGVFRLLKLLDRQYRK